MKRFLVFSGSDAAGKSTQIGLLVKTLRSKGYSTYDLWARGGYTPLFTALKALFFGVPHQRTSSHNGYALQREQILSKSWVRTLWLAMAIWDMIFLYGFWLRLVKLTGRAIICDRYILDTQIDFRLNFPDIQVESWWSWKWLAGLSPEPEVAFLMLIPVSESIRRSEIKREPFRDPAEKLERRLKQYQELASQNYWQILDGRESIQSLAKRIEEEVFS